MKQSMDTDERFLAICERDVGLFSLIQQVVSNIPRALADKRTPVVYFTDRCCYFHPSGYNGRDTVWEYYFEPVVPTAPASVIPETTRRAIHERWPEADGPGVEIDERFVASSHFGDHPELVGRALRIPYLWDDPDPQLRRRAASIIRGYVRPRDYLLQKVDSFYSEHLAGRPVIGVHIRGTDATASPDIPGIRWGSLNLDTYKTEVTRLIAEQPDSLIFVATDEQQSLAFMQRAFGERVKAYDSLKHGDGEPVGAGPTGATLPAYVANNPSQAARNGEEAVADYLTLCRCDHLVHNASSLARTALLAMPGLAHTNTVRRPPFLQRLWRRFRERLADNVS